MTEVGPKAVLAAVPVIFCNEQIAALKRLVTYWGFCDCRAKFKVAGHLGCLRTSAPEKGE